MANHWLVIRPIKHDPSTTRFGPDRAWGGTARCTRGLMCGRIAGRSLTNGGSSLPSTHAASRRGGNVFCRVNGWCSFLGHMIKTFVCKIVSVVMILKLETLCNKLTAVHHWYKLSRWRILFGGILYIVIRTCFVVENLFCSIYAHEYVVIRTLIQIYFENLYKEGLRPPCTQSTPPKVLVPVRLPRTPEHEADWLVFG